MTPANHNITIYAGSDFTRRVRLKAAGVVVDLTGFSARAQIRKKANSTDVLAAFACSVEAPATAGWITLDLTALRTAAMPATGAVYDVELVSPTGRVSRILQGYVSVSPEVTRP